MIGYPRKTDLVAAWLKKKRDEYKPDSEGWIAIDNLLYEYRLMADTGRRFSGGENGG